MIHPRIAARDRINRSVLSFITFRNRYTDNHVNFGRQLPIASWETHENRKYADHETQTLTERRGIDSQMESRRKFAARSVIM